MQMRRMFDHAFRPSAIKEIDPYVEHLAYELLEGFLADGTLRVGGRSTPCRCRST